MNKYYPLRIYLIGFIGAGKSTIGRALSKNLNYDYIDTDEEIEKNEGLKVEEILKIRGEEFFRKKEWELLKEILKKEKIVASFSAGAGASIDFLNLLKKSGMTIFLNAPWELILKRLEEKKEKVKGKGIEDLYKAYISRINIYKKADIVVNLFSNEILEETVKKIERLIREYIYEISYNF